MAFQIFWKIKFKSLRAGTDYTVNIYKDGTLPSGYPLTLKGGAQPFVTEEDDSEDMFTPIRTQSGYLRIVDDGKATNANGDEVVFDWKTLLPSTDTDRPVTLTKTVNSSEVVVWHGFMQAQNFSGTLYGNPQEREFPVQCPLTILEGFDINYTQIKIQNFAYLLQTIIASIPSYLGSTTIFENVYIQGSETARQMMLKRIDWQNFVDEDSDGNLIARFNMYQCLQDLCAFWGWTARTFGKDLYLCSADDMVLNKWLLLSRSALSALASGLSSGTINIAYDAATLTGDIFASTNQEDLRQRGPNKAVVTASPNRGSDDVLDIFNGQTLKTMQDMGQQSQMIHYVVYTNDLLTIDQPYVKLTCREGYASLNIGSFGYAYDAPYINCIRIKRTGGNNVTPFVQMETGYEHAFNDGFLRIFGETYRFTDKYLDPYDEYFIGRSYMYAKIAIGPDRQNAKWWNGRLWQSSETYCRLSIGSRENNLDDNKNEFPFMYLQEAQASDDDWACNILPVSGLQGKLFIDLLGTSDSGVPDIDNEKSFELKDFRVQFTRNPGVVKHGSASDMVYAEDIDRPTSFEYKASNQNNVKEEWNADCIYGSENGCKFSYGLVINTDGTFLTTMTYGTTDQRPEQYLANRVANYWATAKRRLNTELRTENIAAISPKYKLVLDSTTGYPISISHDWCDDITRLTILQL